MDPGEAGAEPPAPKPTSPEKRNSKRAPVDGAPQCTKACCIDDNDANKFHCGICKRNIHYRCSGLPVFQIHHFLHTNNYRKFVCESCTKVADHLKTIIPTPPQPDVNKEISDREKTIREKQVEVDTLAETNRILQAKIKEMSGDYAKVEKCYRKEKNDRDTLQAEARILKTSLKTYEEKVATLENTVNENSSGADATSEGSLASLTQLMANKFEEVENNLKVSILNEVTKNNQRLEEKINEVVQTNRSYANAVTNAENGQSDMEPILANATQDFRSVMREELNAQLAEEAEQKQRACNFVIHGVAEAGGDVTEAKQHDKTIIDALMVDLGLDVSYKSLYRLGKRNDTVEQPKRPIKVVMNSEEDTTLIMVNLKRLKDKENYRGVSITHDHTIKERKTITEWVEKAKAANAAEPIDSIWEWKARGTPKNGMQLKKLRKRNPDARV